ncbi:hypothetical protein NP493_773g00006 [Ridgeia piscesae]|uniref:Uncharacterized protein n=1 Tax=Ridgeia piscesae TaxID=27915 RepID=A0AAD9KQL7_RIDPI|nr:hypothetical protein NP493_773g00006 [Ridgeia piscesae]
MTPPGLLPPLSVQAVHPCPATQPHPSTPAPQAGLGILDYPFHPFVRVLKILHLVPVTLLHPVDLRVQIAPAVQTVHLALCYPLHPSAQAIPADPGLRRVHQVLGTPPSLGTLLRLVAPIDPVTRGGHPFPALHACLGSHEVRRGLGPRIFPSTQPDPGIRGSLPLPDVLAAQICLVSQTLPVVPFFRAAHLFHQVRARLAVPRRPVGHPGRAAQQDPVCP